MLIAWGLISIWKLNNHPSRETGGPLRLDKTVFVQNKQRFWDVNEKIGVNSILNIWWYIIDLQILLNFSITLQTPPTAATPPTTTTTTKSLYEWFQLEKVGIARPSARFFFQANGKQSSWCTVVLWCCLTQCFNKTISSWSVPWGDPTPPSLPPPPPPLPPLPSQPQSSPPPLLS